MTLQRQFLTFSGVLSLLLLFSSCLTAQDAWQLSLQSNWKNDTLPASFNRYNECFGYVDCDGREYGFLGSASYLHIFDLADPTDPIELASFLGGPPTTWRDMKTYRDHLYSVCDNCSEGLMIVDLSVLPEAPALTNQTTEFFGRCHNIFIDQGTGKLYAAGTDSITNGLVVLDLNNDLAAPTFVARTPLPGGYVHDLFAINDTVFCFHGGNGLYVYDFSDPNNPTVLGSLTEYPESGYNHSGWLTPDNNYLVFADESFNRGLKMTDVSDLSDIEVTDLFRSALLGPADTASIAHNPLVRGNLAFISYYHDGVQVFDLTDPENVQKVGYYDTEPNNTNYQGFTGCWGVYPFFPSGNIIASDMNNGLFVLDANALELPPLEGPQPPNAELTFDGEQQFCETDSLVLSLQEGLAAYAWINAGTGDTLSLNASLTIQESGQFFAYLSDGKCSNLSDTVLTQVDTVPLAVITPDPVVACFGQVVTLMSTPGQSYQWFQNDFAIPGSDMPTLQIQEGGLYSVLLTNGNCKNTSQEVEAIFNQAMQPLITFEEGVLMTGNALSYQWYFNGLPINQATNSSWIPLEEGEYIVEIVDKNGCTAQSDPYTYLIDSWSEQWSQSWKAFPNPAQSSITIEFPAGAKPGQLRLYNNLGQIVLKRETTAGSLQIDLAQISAGMYQLEYQTAEKRLIQPLVIQAR